MEGEIASVRLLAAILVFLSLFHVPDGLLHDSSFNEESSSASYNPVMTVVSLNGL